MSSSDVYTVVFIAIYLSSYMRIYHYPSAKEKVRTEVRT